VKITQVSKLLKAEQVDVSVVASEHPTKVTVGKEFEWYVLGHTEFTTTNPAVAYYYKDGVASSIEIVRTDGTKVLIPKGYAWVVYIEGDIGACQNIDSRDISKGAIFPDAGSYTIQLCAGRYDPVEGVFYISDYNGYAVEASPEAPPPPMWLIIAIVLIIALVVILGVAI